MSERVLLLQIILPNGDEFRCQCYQLDPYTYDGQTWDYVPFGIDSQPEQKLELINESAQFSILNTSVVASLVAQYDGLRRAIARLFVVDPSGEYNTIMLALSILSSGPDGGKQIFNLGTPTDAQTGTVITRFFSKREFPQIPARRATL